MCEQKPYIADMVLVLAQKLSDIVWTQPAKTDTKEDNARLKKNVISAFHILMLSSNKNISREVQEIVIWPVNIHIIYRFSQG